MNGTVIECASTVRWRFKIFQATFQLRQWLLCRKLTNQRILNTGLLFINIELKKVLKTTQMLEDYQAPTKPFKNRKCDSVY